MHPLIEGHQNFVILTFPALLSLQLSDQDHLMFQNSPSCFISAVWDRLVGMVSDAASNVLSGVVDDPMGWKSRRGDVAPFLPPDGRLEFFDDVGHFLHIEQPRMIADLVLEFLEPYR